MSHWPHFSFQICLDFLSSTSFLYFALFFLISLGLTTAMVLENRREGDEPAGSAPPLGFSSDGRLTVKIKLPMTVVDEEAPPPPPPPPSAPAEEVKSHFCAECNKSFSSGKALGGHMSSAHVQANKDYSMKKLKSKTGKQSRSSSGFYSGPESEIICSICGKDFPSRKSLFGHMRCHPERPWRGMECPAEPKMVDSPPEASTEPETDDIGLFQEGGFYDNPVGSGRKPGPSLKLPPVSGWPVRAKRGRKSVKSGVYSPHVPSNSEDPEMNNAVLQLLRLVNDSPRKRKVDGAQTTTSSDSSTPWGPGTSNRASGPKKPKICYDKENVNYYTGKGKGVLLPAEPQINYSSSSTDSSSSDDDDSDGLRFGLGLKKFVEDEGAKCRTSTTNKKKVGKKVKLINSIQEKQEEEEEGSSFANNSNNNNVPISSPDNKFICTTCDMSFPTHQALGGHRSSHNKFKLIIYNTIDQQQTTDGSALKEEEENSNNNNDRKNTPISKKSREMQDDDDDHEEEEIIEYLCKICNKSFASGQALRCHKRSHWKNNLQQGSSSRQVITSNDRHEENVETARKVFDFDLNEVPDGDEEDGVHSSNKVDPSNYTPYS